MSKAKFFIHAFHPTCSLCSPIYFSKCKKKTKTKNLLIDRSQTSVILDSSFSLNPRPSLSENPIVSTFKHWLMVRDIEEIIFNSY